MKGQGGMMRGMGDVAAPAGGVIERSVAVRPATVGSDVGVPFFQALICGLLVGAPIGGMAGWLGFDEMVTGAAVGGVGVMTVAWVTLLLDHRRLLWGLERRIGVDLDGDGRTGRPEPAVPVLRVEVAYLAEDGRLGRMQILTVVGVTEQQVVEFARAVTSGKGLAVGVWAGARKAFTRPQYEAWMGELLSAGLVRDEGGNVGRVLTAKGRAVMKGIATSPPAPSS